MFLIVILLRSKKSTQIPRYEQECLKGVDGGILRSRGLLIYEGQNKLSLQLLLNDVAIALGVPATSDGSFGGMFLFLGGWDEEFGSIEHFPPGYKV